MKIAIDIDEVIVDFVRGYLNVYEKRYGKKAFFEDIFSHNFWESLKISKEESLDIADEFYDSEQFDNIGIIEGAKESILELSKNNELFIITSRPLKLKKQTEQFFQTNFNEIPFKIFYSGGFLTMGQTKGEICKNLGISILIEDNKDYALDCAKRGVKVFLLDKPWNKNHEQHERVIKVKNWNEILGHLK